MKEIMVGLAGAAGASVTRENTALSVKSGGMLVLSTPAMAALMEQAAYESVQPLMDEGDTTVGCSIDIRHIAATIMGRNIHAESTVVSVTGRKITFALKAYDEAGLIGEGTHERFVVAKERFIAKAEQRGTPE